MTKTRPVAVDLFSGAGGLSLGLEQAGFDVLAAVEYDPVHAATHAFNFPDTEVICADISKLPSELIRERIVATSRHREGWDGEIDVVVGGPPCQGFSWIGKRKVDDARNDLIFHFFRIVRDLNPRYFVMENVPGITSVAYAAILSDLVSKFEDAGYVVETPKILNAANYGVPQDRRRFILVGRRRNERPFVYPEPTHQPVRPVRGSATNSSLPIGPSVWDAIGELPNLDKFPALLKGDMTVLSPASVATAVRKASPYALRLRGLLRDIDDLSYRRAADQTLLTSSARTSHSQVSAGRFEATQPGTIEPISRFYRLSKTGLANTLRAGTGRDHGSHTSPRPIHPTFGRVISVREAARLHSFPDWFRFHATKWHGFRQIGNSVPPLLGRAIGAALIDALGSSRVLPSRPVSPGPYRLLTLAMGDATTAMGADSANVPQRRTRQDEKAAQG